MTTAQDALRALDDLVSFAGAIAPHKAAIRGTLVRSYIERNAADAEPVCYVDEDRLPFNHSGAMEFIYGRGTTFAAGYDGLIPLYRHPPSDAIADRLAFSDLRDANVARDKEWNTGSERTSLAFRGLELGGETGEALNVLKKLERERIGIRGSRATTDDLADELADVVICVDLIAMDCGIDMAEAVARKFNATSEKYSLTTRLSLHAAAKGGEP